ncbi:MAG: serine/threonine-protein kinase [Nannocystaceae bacterium]
MRSAVDRARPGRSPPRSQARQRLSRGRGAPTVKLLDFGIARVNDTGAGNRTRTGVIMGTPAYMAPEQARGARVDARADIYSVGAILYRCLTGHQPFEAEDPAATLTMVLTREPARPRTLAPQLPESIELVIERAMARKVEERYQSLAELDAALAALQEATGVVAAPVLPSSSSHAVAEVHHDSARAVARARPLLVVLTAVAVLVVVGSIAAAAARVLAASRGEPLGGSEGMLIVLGTAGVLATPVGLWVRWLRRGVWGNSMRAIALARRLGTMLAAATIAYAAIASLVASVDLLASEAPTATMGATAAVVGLVAALVAAVVVDRLGARTVPRDA